jgi:mannose-6-phosphate isomerase-like protein (cupin superfamily)
MGGWHGSFSQALENLAGSDGHTATMFVHGTLKVLLYAPKGSDQQIPHDRDEVYVVASGSGRFQLGDSIIGFAPGDVIFVPAGVEHRFVEFGDDLSAWVMFYGPKGGEAA